MRTGEKKVGRILAENEGTILFQDNAGLVSDVPASSVAILDRSDLSKKTGGVSLFTTSPRKKKKPVPTATPFQPSYSGVDSKQTDTGGREEAAQSFQLEMMDKMLQAWLDKHPEALKWLETAAEKTIQKSADFDHLVEEAKKANA